MRIRDDIRPGDLTARLQRFWELSADKILALHKRGEAAESVVVTVNGQYVRRPWTDWTNGFRLGSVLLQFEATGDQAFLEIGRAGTVMSMESHLTDFGVHDHGFNTVSTYGVLKRLMDEGRIADEPWQRRYCELALRVSGAVQAHRWTDLNDTFGYIYSFNGPHSLFVDTLRSLRSLALAHMLGYAILDEGGKRVSLLERLKKHLLTTVTYSVYFGTGRDVADTVSGRVAHESIFDVIDGSYRCPSTQQGWSPFTTWTRGLAWAMCGFAEQLEFLEAIGEEPASRLLAGARATCDFYIDHATAADGIPYWDTGAPGLRALGDWRDRPADPFNDCEPVDSSAAAIAGQGLLRLGAQLGQERYVKAGLSVLETLLEERYLSMRPEHEGLILHSVYHQPNGWDHVPPGRRVTCGESSMWGDYHARELALYVTRLAAGETPPMFFGGGGAARQRIAWSARDE